MSALPGAGIAFMAYGKIPKPTFEKNILACYLGELKNCSTESQMNLTVYFYSEGLLALSEGFVDFEIRLVKINVKSRHAFVFVKSQRKQRKNAKILFEPACVYCTVGSYASLSVRLSHL